MRSDRKTGQMRWVLVLLAAFGLAALAACSSQERPVAPVSLVVPTQLGVNTVDTAGVFASVRQHLEFAGMKADRSRSDSAKGVFVSQPVRCAPNSDERHVTLCVFSANVAASTTNPLQVAVDVRVRPGTIIKYEPEASAVQIRIEPTLDSLVSSLRSKFSFAEVTKTGTITF